MSGICDNINLNDSMRDYLKRKFGICRNAKLDRFNQTLYYNGNPIKVNCKDVPGVCSFVTPYGETHVIQGGKKSRRNSRSNKRTAKKGRTRRKK